MTPLRPPSPAAMGRSFHHHLLDRSYNETSATALVEDCLLSFAVSVATAPSAVEVEKRGAELYAGLSVVADPDAPGTSAEGEAAGPPEPVSKQR